MHSHVDDDTNCVENKLSECVIEDNDKCLDKLLIKYEFFAESSVS